MIRPDLTIDPDNLHEEWMRQPHLAYEYGEQLADAELEKANIRSDLSKKYREKHSGISEVKLRNLIEENKTYIKICNKVNSLKSVMDAIQTRKKALEKLAELWIGQYWSTPKEPRTREREFEQNVSKERSRTLNERLNKREE